MRRISNLLHLEDLCLKFCRLTDEVLCELCLNIKTLKTLDISFCQNLTDVSLNEVKEKYPGLQVTYRRLRNMKHEDLGFLTSDNSTMDPSKFMMDS